MDERTVLCEAIAISNDTNNPVLAKRIRDDCNYTATLGIAGGYYDGPRAYNLQIQFLISPGGRSEWDKNFYELAWKAHKEQGPLQLVIKFASALSSNSPSLVACTGSDHEEERLFRREPLPRGLTCITGPRGGNQKGFRERVAQ